MNEEQDYYLKEEHLRKCFSYLEKAQNEVNLRFTNHKITDKIINDVYNFIEEQKEQLAIIYQERFE